MYEFRVNDKIYKIKYGYGVLYKSDLIDRVFAASTGAADTPADVIKNFIGLTAELLLAGLQKCHSDEFGYDPESESERNAMIQKVSNLIDDYEEEHEDEDVDEKKDGVSLFNDLQAELEKNGFLSRMAAATEETAADLNATKVPTDHQRKRRKAGEKA